MSAFNFTIQDLAVVEPDVSQCTLRRRLQSIRSESGLSSSKPITIIHVAKYYDVSIHEFMAFYLNDDNIFSKVIKRLQSLSTTKLGMT